MVGRKWGPVRVEPGRRVAAPCRGPAEEEGGCARAPVRRRGWIDSDYPVERSWLNGKEIRGVYGLTGHG